MFINHGSAVFSVPANANIAPIQVSGSANVPTQESTGGQYQGADIADDLMFPYSGQTTAINANIVFSSGSVSFPSAQSGGIFGLSVIGPGTGSGVSPLGGSGGGTATVTVGGSGYLYPGSGFSIFAPGSGIFTPAGWFMINVAGMSGAGFFKVPFFNS